MSSQLKHVTVFAVVLLVGAVVATMAGTAAGVGAQQATTAVVLRTVLVLPLLLLIARWRTTVACADDTPKPVALAAVAGVLAYLLNPFAWAGRALFGQLVTEPGAATMLLDGVVWVLVVVAGARWVSSRVRRTADATPYG